MPFKSEAQRKYLHSQHPEIASRWEAERGASQAAKNKLLAKPRSARAVAAAKPTRVAFTNTGNTRKVLTRSSRAVGAKGPRPPMTGTGTSAGPVPRSRSASASAVARAKGTRPPMTGTGTQATYARRRRPKRLEVIGRRAARSS